MADVGPYGTVGTDYREMQAPVQVDTDLPSSGAAQRAAALHQVFQEFEGLAGNEYNALETKAGALAGAAAGATGHPQYREGLNQFTAYSRAFNNAATGQYAIEAEAQADADATRLRVQANNNPETFRATFSAARDAVLKNAPAMAVPMLTELYNKRLAAGLAAISGDQATQLQQTHRQAYDFGIDRQTSKVAWLQGSTNPHDQIEALDEQVKLTTMIDGGVKAGLYSEAEAQAMHINAARTITAQVFETQLDRELADPHGDPVGLLENFRKAHEANLANKNEPPILSEEEFDKLMMDGKQKVLQQNMMEAYARRDGKTAEELRFEAGDQKYTGMLLDHTLTESALSDAVRNQDLKPETARVLRAQMLSNATGAVTKSLPAAYARVAGDPNFLDMSITDIASAPGVSDADKIKLYNEQQTRLKSWENTQNVKDGKNAISAALKIPPGTPSAALSDAQRAALTSAQQDYLQLLQGTDPAKRDAYAPTAAQIAIRHQQEHEAAADALTYQSAMTRFIQRYGPGGSESMDPKDYQTRLQHYRDLIKQNQDASKGD